MFDFSILIASLMFLATPGPAPVALAACGAASGLKAGVRFYLGILSGFLVVMVLSLSGVSLLLESFPLLSLTLMAIGFAYIFYLAYKIGSAPPLGRLGHESFTYRAGFLINLTNVKLYAVFASMLVGFAPQEAGFWGKVSVALTMFATTAVTNMIWLLVGERLAQIFKKPRENRFLRTFLALMMVVAVFVAVIRVVKAS